MEPCAHWWCHSSISVCKRRADTLCNEHTTCLLFFLLAAQVLSLDHRQLLFPLPILKAGKEDRKRSVRDAGWDTGARRVRPAMQWLQNRCRQAHGQLTCKCMLPDLLPELCWKDKRAARVNTHLVTAPPVVVAATFLLPPPVLRRLLLRAVLVRRLCCGCPCNLLLVNWKHRHDWQMKPGEWWQKVLLRLQGWGGTQQSRVLQASVWQWRRTKLKLKLTSRRFRASSSRCFLERKVGLLCACFSASRFLSSSSSDSGCAETKTALADRTRPA